ncbi:MAG: universal stress protein [Myxococcales bacterium]|nr:universal stress protein [Myxococcales bacterium]
MSSLIQRILVPVDFSPHSRAAARLAQTLARESDASLCFLHVWTASDDAELVIATHGGGQQTLRSYRELRAKRDLDTFIDSMNLAAGCSLETRTVEGEARASILEQAIVGEFDLIVMGTSGRSGLERLLLGSVAEDVVRRSPCPVLTIRDEQQVLKGKAQPA